MILRSLISLLLVFGLANTTTLAASTSQLLVNQQVEWYSDAQGDKTTRVYPLFYQVEKTIDYRDIHLRLSLANRTTANLISVKLRLQKQFLYQGVAQHAIRTVILLYPEEDSTPAFIAS